MTNLAKNTFNKWTEKIIHIKYLNRWIVFVADMLISVMASGLAFVSLATGVLSIPMSMGTLLKVTAISLIASGLSFILFKTYKRIIRHASFADFFQIFNSILYKEIIILAVIYGIGWFNRFFLFYGLIDFLYTSFLMVSIRILMIVVYRFLRERVDKEHAKKVFVYGTKEDSITLINMLRTKKSMQYYVAGLITMTQSRGNLELAGYNICYIPDIDALKRIVEEEEVSTVIFPNYETVAREKNRLIEYCMNLHIEILVAPPILLENNKKQERTIQEIRIEDLLGREEICIKMDEIEKTMQGKTVLVTGAAGSIGSELVRQLARFSVRQLILLDNAETPTHNLQLELQDNYPHLRFIPIIGDIRIQERLEKIFDTYRPEIVFHAAAYKHVPLMENNPCEAVRVNVLGSRNVADCAVKYGAEKFIMISTDKAVNPTNVMGATKRTAEIYVQSLDCAIEEGRIEGKTRFITTRFGNVLGSNGSVIPRFQEQIKRGGPVTVTHPDIIRYFMTIPEACRLVLEAAVMGEGGEIFVFDMGEQVRIAELARRMISLAGFVPDRDIKIEYTGLRPGEKLYEELLSNVENTRSTTHKKIRIAEVRRYAYETVQEEIGDLTALYSDPMGTVRALKHLIPEYVSQNSAYECLDKTKNENKNA